ncbi:histidine-containing phosphotransfer protein 1-like isoform X3 [Quercus robur]|uniref:histidine-containing phosphotransfer protein 1-like isoform X3 n=1 Tax=Quercus robur TaxID=38942 RepID=UPI0021618C9F|nr:histidine-containing phosphotransfer protein 1-like isoform X3 [Quercus robur]
MAAPMTGHPALVVGTAAPMTRHPAPVIRMVSAVIESLHLKMGYVNDQFWQIQQMKKTNQPDYAVRAVTSYCMSAQNLFTQLTDHINQENVDFHQVNVSAHELFEQSNSVGAAHVKHACVELLHACEDNDKDYCSKTLYWTKNEFSQLKRKFETVVQTVAE